MAIDIQDTSLGEKSREQRTYAMLYDPPVNGETPLDGEGNPRTSRIHGPDITAKLKQGFTREPVLPPAPPAEEKARAKK